MKSISKKLTLWIILTILATAALTAMAAEQRNDDAIKSWVKNAISEDPHVDTAGIKVEVSEGIVTLSGKVKNLAAKSYADLEAKKIAGVLGVINEITVSPAHILDTDIVQMIRHRIINDAAIESDNIEVTCIDGKVTLAGSVASLPESEEAGLLASEVRGVKDVRNNLSIVWVKNRSDYLVKEDVVASLKRDVYLTNQQINVSVKDGVATLSGTVENGHQKTCAYMDAIWVNDIKSVNNEIKIKLWNKEGVRSEIVYPGDDELVKTVTDEIMQDSRLAPVDLAVAVSYGHATLKGSVANYRQKNIAEADIRDVVGVGGVTNDLVVRSAKRDDARIRDDIFFDIEADDILWNQDIKIKVNDGVVTLSGRVDSPHDKTHTTALASRIRGVRGINNKIKVDWKQDYKDGALFGKIVERIVSDGLLSPVKNKIDVKVKKGVVTLTGTVYNGGERREAGRVAYNTSGVSMVDNRLKVEGYNYRWEDWNLRNPDALFWFYEYDYPYGYHRDIYHK